jgi:hypothetical protein
MLAAGATLVARAKNQRPLHPGSVRARTACAFIRWLMKGAAPVHLASSKSIEGGHELELVAARNATASTDGQPLYLGREWIL